MAHERNKENLGRKTLELSHCLEAKPGLSLRSICVPVALVGELELRVSSFGNGCMRMSGGVELCFHHVHMSVGKIINPTGMIKIKMSDDDMANILGIKTEASDLGDGGFFFTQRRAEEISKKAIDAFTWLLNILRSQTRVDENESFFGFD
jgi:hypothetical protein